MTHKFGVKSPHLHDKAATIDQETGATFWRDTIVKEMKTVREAVTRKDDHTLEKTRDGKVLIGCQETTGHLVFDVNMDGQFA